jgi:hypothetical protein
VSGNLGGEAYCHQVLGGGSLLDGDRDVAEKRYRLAVKLREQAGEQLRLAGALEEIGQSYLGIGDATTAAQYLVSALEVYKVQGRTDSVGRVKDLLNFLG